MTRAGSRVAQRLSAWGLLASLCASPAPLRAGSPLPLAVEDVRSGQPTQLEPGPRVLHVVLFATWCPPCVAELDRLAELEERWGESGYRLVLVAVQNRHTRERLQRFADSRRPPGTLLFDSSRQVQRSLRIEELPAHVVFDAAGSEIARAEMLDDDLVEKVGRLVQPRNGGP